MVPVPTSGCAPQTCQPGQRGAVRPPAPPYLPASRLLLPALLRLFLLLSSFLLLSPSPCCLGLFMEIHSFMPSHRSLSVSLPPGGRACDASPLSSHFLLSQSGAAPAPKRRPSWDTRGQRRAVGPSPSAGGRRGGGETRGGRAWARHRPALGGIPAGSVSPRGGHPGLSAVPIAPRSRSARAAAAAERARVNSQPPGNPRPLFPSLLAPSQPVLPPLRPLPRTRCRIASRSAERSPIPAAYKKR